MEAVAYTSKATSKMGKIDNGSSIFDHRTDEKNHRMTISMHLGHCEWNNAKINILDTPGFLDLLGDARSALRVVETAVILVDAHSGVQVGTELVSSLVDEAKTSRVIFVNGMDKENVDFEETLSKMREAYGTAVAPLVIPIGTGAGFIGVIDLITKDAYKYTREGNGIGEKIEIPAELVQMVDTYRQSLMESVAETSEELMNLYFEHGELTDAELRDGLSKGVAEGNVYPLIAGSALLNMGIDQFLTKIVNLCPSAESRKEEAVLSGDSESLIVTGVQEPLSAFVFKTLSEEHLGEINCVRVFCGKLTTGTDVINTVRGNNERVGNM
jgi:elongation factor G